MNDKQAERVSYLISAKKQLEGHLGMIKHPDIEFRISYRIKGGMYDGHPHGVTANEFELSEKKISDFVIHVLQDKLDNLSNELESI